jgi:hypothetical protein
VLTPWRSFTLGVKGGRSHPDVTPWQQRDDVETHRFAQGDGATEGLTKKRR